MSELEPIRAHEERAATAPAAPAADAPGGWLRGRFGGVALPLGLGLLALVGGFAAGTWLRARNAAEQPVSLESDPRSLAGAGSPGGASDIVGGQAADGSGDAAMSDAEFRVYEAAMDGGLAGQGSSEDAAGSRATGSFRVALGEPAPDFSLPSPDGEKLIALSDFAGRPVLVNFWATWCPPCRTEMPLLQAQYEAREEEGLVVLAVDVGEEPLDVQAYLNTLDHTFPVVLDLFGDVADYYRVVTFPTTYSIDRDGLLRSVKHGAYTSEAELVEAVDALLEPAADPGG